MSQISVNEISTIDSGRFDCAYTYAHHTSFVRVYAPRPRLHIPIQHLLDDVEDVDRVTEGLLDAVNGPTASVVT